MKEFLGWLKVMLAVFVLLAIGSVGLIAFMLAGAKWVMPFMLRLFGMY